MSREFMDLFEAPREPETALDVARYWATRRGRGEPTAEDVAREQLWESIVGAAERSALIDAEILGPDGADWSARVGSIPARIPERWGAIAEPPLAPGMRALRVLSYDRVTEELTLRPLAPGEPAR